MKFLKRIGCLFGRHLRSKQRARIFEGTYYSVCSYCGVQMRQVGKKQWVVERER